MENQKFNFAYKADKSHFSEAERLTLELFNTTISNKINQHIGFDSLKDKCNFYRNLPDFCFERGQYLLIMLDGRTFSKKIKKKFKEPFDDDFIDIMNKTAIYLCENIQGCKMAYVQSDEITLVVTDFETEQGGSFFKYRACKILSLCASMATAKFNQLMLLNKVDRGLFFSLSKNEIEDSGLYEFDCKAWNVSSYYDVYAWLVYRQLDCIRNSKQQTAQAYLSHNDLMNKNCDEQIALLEEERGVIWESFNDGQKFGRFIYREEVNYNNIMIGMTYKRYCFVCHDAFPLSKKENKEKFNSLMIIPKRENIGQENAEEQL